MSARRAVELPPPDGRHAGAGEAEPGQKDRLAPGDGKHAGVGLNRVWGGQRCVELSICFLRVPFLPH
ncbi:MAG: hypothetical protein O2912_02455 [Proteobacteria bacterium]|nr:hypothetical protein [Pseudomonadota bacterium]